MKRKNNNITRFYMSMSIICLTVLFIGYSYVYNLSQARKTGKDITTISLNYDKEKTTEKYNRFFAKIMSYFNIFFEETFKEYDDKVTDDSKDDETNEEEVNEEETNKKDSYEMIDSEDESSAKNLDAFNESQYESDSVAKTQVYMADNRKDNFFTIKESNEAVSRASVPREVILDSKAINKTTNIILYHTHGTEAYKPHDDSNYRTKDESFNVMGLGTKIAKNLEHYGLKVNHLTAYNDYPSYNLSYRNSLNAVKKELSKNKKNVMVDIHRDGADENSDYEKFLSQVATIKVDNKLAATYTLVIGEKNGNLKELKKIAQTMYDISNEMYPGLCREIIVRSNSYFNQEISDYAMLIEIGSTLNTIDEAQYTADMVSEILCKTIVKINN